jgi:hypothetical protein
MKRWLLALPLLAAACAERAKVGDGPYAGELARDIPRVEKTMGMKFKSPPRLEVRSRDQVREFLLLKLKEPIVQKQFVEAEATYKALGLIPDTMKLPDLYVKILTEQILGYYDPKTKVLYMVKDAPEDYAAVTLLHELAHALQDQYVNLDSLQRIEGDDDRAAAVQAVIEGQATFETVYIAAGGSGNIAAHLPGGMDGMRDAIRQAQETQPFFSSAPIAVKEALLFPYVNGFDYIRRFVAKRPNQFPFDSMPVSTEQLMHEAAFFGKTKDVPSTVTLPPVPGQIAQNGFGEFGTRVFIYQHTRDQDRSIRASVGWDGDRYAVVKMPTGNAIVWASVWDTDLDAAEFVSAIDAVVQKRFFIKPEATGQKRRFETSKRTVEIEVRELGGRSVVLYTEVPAGSEPKLLDFSRVKVIAQ